MVKNGKKMAKKWQKNGKKIAKKWQKNGKKNDKLIFYIIELKSISDHQRRRRTNERNDFSYDCFYRYCCYYFLHQRQLKADCLRRTSHVF